MDGLDNFSSNERIIEDLDEVGEEMSIGTIILKSFPYPISNSFYRLLLGEKRVIRQKSSCFELLKRVFSISEIYCRLIFSILVSNYIKEGMFDSTLNTSIVNLINKNISFGDWVKISQDILNAFIRNDKVNQIFVKEFSYFIKNKKNKENVFDLLLSLVIVRNKIEHNKIFPTIEEYQALYNECKEKLLKILELSLFLSNYFFITPLDYDDKFIFNCLVWNGKNIDEIKCKVPYKDIEKNSEDYIILVDKNDNNKNLSLYPLVFYNFDLNDEFEYFFIFESNEYKKNMLNKLSYVGITDSKAKNIVISDKNDTYQNIFNDFKNYYIEKFINLNSTLSYSADILNIEKIKELYGRDNRNLKIHEGILCNFSTLDTEGRAKIHQNKDVFKYIESIWETDERNLVIYAEGGMGKTVCIKYLWRYFMDNYSSYGIFPIYIPLNEYNFFDSYSRENYIFNYIKKHYLGKEVLSEFEINRLWEIFRNKDAVVKNKYPSVILFLDGFNELPEDKDNFLAELFQLAKRATGMQIVISSRSDIRVSYALDDYTGIKLEFLSEEQISEYINSFGGVGSSDVDYSELVEILKNPMMLTLYMDTYDKSTNNKMDSIRTAISSKGELLWNYFEYIIDNHYKKCIINSKQQMFYKYVYSHIIPCIAYSMVSNDLFVIGNIQFNEILSNIFGCYDIDEFFNAFPEFFDYEEVLPLGDVSPKDKRMKIRRIKNIIIEDLNIIVSNEGTFEFYHQYFRDYFAALYITNHITYRLANKKTPEELVSRLQNDEVLKMAGEVIGEHKNKVRLVNNLWEYKPKSNVLSELITYVKTAQVHSEILISNIINTLLISRKELTGMDFVGMDLSSISLDGVYCSRKDANKHIITNFGSSLLKYDVMPKGHRNEVRSICVSKRNSKILTASNDSTVIEWDLDNKKKLKVLRGHSNRVLSVAYSKDERKMVTGCCDRDVRLWDLESEELIRTFTGHTGSVESVIFIKDDKYILSTSVDKTIIMWSVETGDIVKRYIGHVNYSKGVSFYEEKDLIISTSYDRTIKIWDASSCECKETLIGHKGTIFTVDIDKINNYIITASADKTIKLWDLNMGICVRTFSGHRSSVNSAFFNKDFSRILSASDDGSIREWEVVTGECIALYFKEQKSPVITAKYSREETSILGGYEDGSLVEWDVEKKKPIVLIKGSNRAINRIKYNFSNDNILSTSNDGSVKEWDKKLLKCINVYKYGNTIVRDAEYNKKSDRLLMAYYDGMIVEIDLLNGSIINRYMGHTDSVNTVIYSCDESRILSASNDRSIREWDVKNGKCLKVYNGHDAVVFRAVYNGDSTKILSSSFDNTLKIWDTISGKCINQFEGWIGIFNKHENRILCACKDFIIREYEITSGKCLKEFNGHKEVVFNICYSNDEKRILSCSLDGNIIEWDVDKQKPKKIFRGHHGAVMYMNYDLSGSKMISCGDDGVIIEWDIETGESLFKIHDSISLIVQKCTFGDERIYEEFNKEMLSTIKQYNGVFGKG